MKEEKEREEKEKDEKDRNQWMTEDSIYQEMEKAKKQCHANMEVQKIQIQQMAEKQAKKQQEKQADLDYDAQKLLFIRIKHFGDKDKIYLTTI
ncbi:PREDICTED: coiled-coil domain-containing protein 173-like [Lepidothrix coronata]|uniref:Coiled-coil domain-containing protein 173-like n=1 Tax=Lepidothrix coronata TaxID=321398 RepID=A0A6J0IY64_9PASS|nr:PREDICTED: coiled-coil domain-containing protein 173-like [Lepidothrix coronata]